MHFYEDEHGQLSFIPPTKDQSFLDRVMPDARALWFDGTPVVMTKDWNVIYIGWSWPEAVDAWRRAHP